MKNIRNFKRNITICENKIKSSKTLQSYTVISVLVYVKRINYNKVVNMSYKNYKIIIREYKMDFQLRFKGKISLMTKDGIQG